jgi:cytochrome c oxidase subunit 3
MATDDQIEHDLHHVPESWWTPIMGLSTLFIGLAIFFIGKSVLTDDASQGYIGFFFLILFFILFAGALLSEISKERFSRSDLEAEYRYKELVEQPKGFAKHSFIWIFLASETIFFTLVIGASLVIRVKTNGYALDGGWNPLEELDTFLTAINTFVLIVSSYTMVKALQTIETEGDVKKNIPIFGEVSKTGLFLFATFLLGLLSISIQASEYITLWNEGFRPDTTNPDLNPYFPATFYLQTGFHGLHVFFGVFIMFFVALKAFRGGYSKKNHASIELVGYYWHFVDLIWVLLFTVVYLF